MSPARRGAGGAGQESATARLTRLLTMVPWLLNRQGVDIAEAATEFGVSTAQIESDLALLFVCGLPGGMPDDLIEAEWESGRVYLSNADTIARPLRLGLDEALTLIVGLRTLAQVPGIVDRAAIERTLTKLEQAIGQGQAATAGAASSRIHVDIAPEAAPEHLAALRTALTEHRRVHLRYLVPSRDETTERDVDPMRLTNVDGRWYLEGWCHRSRDTRLFRLDRVERLEVLELDGTPPPQARPRDLDAGLFQPHQDDCVVTLRLEPEALWVADYYPHEGAEPDEDGGATIHIRTPDTTWLRRLLWRLGGSARVLHPAALAREVQAGANEALRLHDADLDAS